MSRYERVRPPTVPYRLPLPRRLSGHAVDTGISSNMFHFQVATADADDHVAARSPPAIPNSPPPSFRSYPSSRRPSRDNLRRSEEERDLDNAFDAPSDDEEEDNSARDRRRLIIADRDASTPVEATTSFPSAAMAAPNSSSRPTYTPASSSARALNNNQVNDGVFANLNAKPRAGDDVEEKPPVSLSCPFQMKQIANRLVVIRTGGGRCDATILGDNRSFSLPHDRQS